MITSVRIGSRLGTIFLHARISMKNKVTGSIRKSHFASVPNSCSRNWTTNNHINAVQSFSDRIFESTKPFEPVIGSHESLLSFDGTNVARPKPGLAWRSSGAITRPPQTVPKHHCLNPTRRRPSRTYFLDFIRLFGNAQTAPVASSTLFFHTACFWRRRRASLLNRISLRRS